MARILIIDDDPIIRVMMKDIIEKYKSKYFNSDWKISINEVDSAIDALESMKVNNYELIITDILMAKMDGWEFIKEIRKNKDHAELPIIVVSAIDGVELEYLAIKHGVSAWFTKPLHPKEFAKCIFNLIIER